LETGGNLNFGETDMSIFFLFFVWMLVLYNLVGFISDLVVPVREKGRNTYGAVGALTGTVFIWYVVKMLIGLYTEENPDHLGYLAKAMVIFIVGTLTSYRREILGRYFPYFRPT
jgi:hypothetical protein